MKIEYYENMLEQEAINKYLNMIANDYNGELARIFEEKYINKDKEIERLNNIINELERYINEEYIYDELGMKIFDASELQDKLQELKVSNGAIPPEVIGTNGEDGELFDYGDR